jgi:6-hydroxynicotinate 3-monooxygenase
VKKLSVAIIGAGMAGLATAAALCRVGISANIYEQARQFARVGGGIQIGCNAMKVLRTFGLEPSLRMAAFYPRSWNNKDFDTGKVPFDMIFGEAAEEQYGAPYLLAHRADLHAALASLVPDGEMRLGHQLTSLEQHADGSIRLTFANGATADADAVVGADGVHSLIRDILFGKDLPNFTGRVAYTQMTSQLCQVLGRF